MKIDIQVRDGSNTAFDFKVANYPAKLTFVDALSKTVVEVNLELDAFTELAGNIFKTLYPDLIVISKDNLRYLPIDLQAELAQIVALLNKNIEELKQRKND